MGDVGMAVQRAEDKTAQMQARAGAIDELLASGALEDFTGSGQQDDIQAELDRMSSTSDVELEMRRLKGELGEATAPAQIEGARGAGQPSTATAGQASQQVPPAKPADQPPAAGEGAWSSGSWARASSAWKTEPSPNSTPLTTSLTRPSQAAARR